MSADRVGNELRPSAQARLDGARLRGGKYLTFHLANEEYGIAILKVSEIIGPKPITRVPGVPDFVRGVINLRGKVVPVTDLRRKFGIVRAGQQDGCIVVVALHGMTTALAVDRVGEVSAIAEDDIEDAPGPHTGIHSEFLLGIARSGARVRMLLDIDRVLAASELETLALHDEPAA